MVAGQTPADSDFYGGHSGLARGAVGHSDLHQRTCEVAVDHTNWLGLLRLNGGGDGVAGVVSARYQPVAACVGDRNGAASSAFEIGAEWFNGEIVQATHISVLLQADINNPSPFGG
jgi:hypothetical protein